MNSNFIIQLKRKARKMFINNFLIILFPALMMLLYSQAISEIIDNVMKKSFEKIYIEAAILIVIILISTVIMIVWKYITNKLIEKNKQDIKILFYKSICNRDIHELNSITYGEGKERISDDFERIYDYYINVIPKLLVSIIIVLGYTVYLVNSSFEVCIVISLLAWLQCIVPLVITKYLKVNYEEMRKVEEKLTDYVVFSYKGFETIKLYDIRKKYLSKMKKIHDKYSKVGKKAELTAASENIMNNFMDNVLTYGFYAILGVFVLHNFISINVSAQFIVVAGTFFLTYKAIFEVIQEWGVCKIAKKRIIEWTTDDSLANKHDRIKLGKNIVLNDVVVYDENDNTILDVPRLRIDTSKRNYICGSNGSGKSTLLKIILKELQTDKGEVIYEGVNLRDLSDMDISNRFIYLPQLDPEIHFTAVELFKNARPNKKKNIVKKMINNALELGVEKEALYKERIKDLSLGNRKKVFLSFALSFENKCLILDEPTNYLDVKGIEIFLEKMRNHMGGLIIVSHDKRLNEYSECQYNIVDGRIYEG